MSNKTMQPAKRPEDAMLETVRTAIARSHTTLLPDTLGALALVVLLVGALHLPSFV